MLVPVTFDPSGVIVWVPPGTTLLDASLAAGVPIHAQCGGRGTCGTCAVRVIQGDLSDPDPDEQDALARAPRAVRLGCRARAVGPVRVEPLTPLSTVSQRTTRALNIGEHLVAAVDLGTTTVAAVVLGCGSGLEYGRAIVPNRQQSYGADVLSRLARAQAGAGQELAAAARESVREALELASGPHVGALESVVVAGNTAMAALLTEADVSRLAVAPFEAPELPGIRADDLIPGAPFTVDVLEPIASFVGGDTRAGLIATGITGSEAPRMLLDVGTNAEVALVIRGRLHVTSAAAGPAFEGGGLGCGGPAVEGAGVRVRLGDGDGDVEVLGLGDSPARWLSGSGVVSAIALLVRAGHVDESGRMTEEGPLRSRFSRAGDMLAVDLGTLEHPIELTQLDVRAFQLAKAAVRVAVEAVMDMAGVSASELEALHVAGAFGGSLDPEDMALLGLIPPESAGVVRQAGNASLAGAAVVACDLQAESGSVQAAASAALHVNLAGDPGFSAALMNAIGFTSSQR